MRIRQLRNPVMQAIRRVRAGEAFAGTDDGAPAAAICLVQHGRVERLIAAGEVTPPASPDRPLDLVSVTGPMTASEALEEDRPER
jgi:antitoxin (DNA-binding transcriptional repressor) of toxin-antitoxin stability system